MSRTLKDHPDARRSRAARRFAEREDPFDWTPGPRYVEVTPEDRGILTLAVLDDDEVFVRAELTGLATPPAF